MANRSGGNFLPSAEAQAAIAAFEASVVYERAKKAAKNGADPDTAAHWAVQSFNISVLFWIFIAPPFFMVTFVMWMFNPLFLVWKLGVMLFGILISMRYIEYMNTPAQYKKRYEVSTPALLAIGGLWLSLFFVFYAFLGVIKYFIESSSVS